VDDDRGHGPGVIYAERVVLATGGSSYPNSGTTGDGWPWAKALGHSVKWIHAALAPIYLELDPFDPARSGIALRDVVVRAKSNKKEIARWRNDMLFTHQGVSGPTILGISRMVAEAMPTSAVHLFVDLFPEVEQEGLIETFLTEGRQSPKRQVATLLEERMPERIVPAVCADASVDPSTALGQLEKKARNRLVEMLKNWPLGAVRTVSLEKGEVVAGGVKLDEVDPQSMRSKVVSGLYLCGEILDVAGPVGGYNLQAAFATGFVAGETAAQDVFKENQMAAGSITSKG
jgi:predicted Rossmann fold flavoprotein